MDLNPQIKNRDLIYAGKYLDLGDDAATQKVAMTAGSEKSESVGKKSDAGRPEPVVAKLDEVMPVVAVAPFGRSVGYKPSHGFYVAGRAGIAQMDNRSTQWLVDDATLTKSYILNDARLVDRGAAYTIAAGYDFSPIRVEAEYGFAYGFNESGAWTFNSAGGPYPATWKIENRVQTIFANAYWDINLGGRLVPYIGAGAGYADVREHVSTQIPGIAASDMVVIENRKNIAWNVGGGLSWNFCDNLAAELGYRFSNLGHVNENMDEGGIQRQEINRTYMLHEALLGLRYKF
jgi:opacity protein-like surface antigen